MPTTRVIGAPRAAVWAAWANPETLTQWRRRQGFSYRTRKIDIRTGGEWVFDMIGPDGAIYPNHHRYREVKAPSRIAYALYWGESGPKHADAAASLDEQGGATTVTLSMTFATEAEHDGAMGFGAAERGQETLAKLERFVRAG